MHSYHLIHMNKFGWLLPLLFILGLGTAHAAPRFNKQAIADTGAFCYLPAPAEFRKSVSADGSDVFNTEVEAEGLGYGLIAVRLNDDPGTDPEVWERQLLTYLQHLGSTVFKLRAVADPGFGQRLDSSPEARGILLIGEDADGETIWIKGWANQQMVAVLYVYGRSELNASLTRVFLDGFRFPAKP